MKSKILLFLFGITYSLLSAQTTNFTVSNGTYTDLVASTSLNNGLTWDDPQFTIPIGFNFQYFNRSFSTIYISWDGYGGLLSPDSVLTGTTSLLFAYGADIMDRGNLSGSNQPGSLSPISYKLSGLTGSRILKIEWKNVGFYSEIRDDSVSTDFTNFQLWLYEGSNAIELHFGPNSITQPSLCYDGNTGTNIALYPEYDLSNDSLLYGGFEVVGSPTFPGLVTVNTNTAGNNFINGPIPNGMIYRFENNSVANDEVLENQFSMELLPNPAQSYFEIQLDNPSVKVDQVMVTDLTGKTVMQLDGFDSKVDVSTLGAGTYFVTVSSKYASVTKKLVKL